MKKILLILIIPMFLAGCSDSLKKKFSSKNNSVVKTENPAKKPSRYGVIPTIPNFFAVSPELFQELYDTGEMTVIDLRTPEEIADGKIFDESLEINFYDPKFREKISRLDKDKKYLLYCRSGGRSGKALEMFKELGFREAYDLAGGKLAWDNYVPTKTQTNQNFAGFREINISAKRYEFGTTEIRVKQGEKVVLKIDNQDVTHGINIENLNQRDDEQIDLDTSQKGTFEFGCNNLCGLGHSDMKGKIIIE